MANAPSLPAWSYSALTQFEQCPKKYYHLRVAKDVKDVPHEANIWGNRVHKALENRAKHNAPLPEGLEKFEPMMAKLTALPGERLYEQRLALTPNLQPCGYFDQSVWYRGVVDYAVLGSKEAIALDYKSGKKRFGFDQLSLTAATLMSIYPQLQSVRTSFVWLQTGELTSKMFSRDSHSALWAEFIPRARRIGLALDENKFPARPGPLCGWCPVKSCPHWVQNDRYPV